MRNFLLLIFFAASFFGGGAASLNAGGGEFSAAKSAQTPEPVRFSISLGGANPKASEPFFVFANFEIPRGSYIYAEDAGDAGLPTKVELGLPKGFKLLEKSAPKPETEKSSEFNIKIYKKSLRIAFKIMPPENAAGTFKISAKASWLQCSGALCLPAGAESSLNAEFPEGSGGEKSPKAPESKKADSGFLAALFGAFLGGAILNFMPCVFPVLGLKAMSLLKDSGGAKSGAALYCAGIVSSFALLAAILLFLRKAGSEIGWGFQLQEPAFVAFLVLLFVAMGLSFAGMFEIGAGLTRLGNIGGGGTKSGAFLSGVLAVAVASPCTAPFMGSAVGLALAGGAGAGKTFAVFIFLGLGMAAPYCALSLIPALRNRMPKPGAWMETFKQFLAFPMFAAAIWLLSVFAKQRGADAAAILMLGALCLAFGLWIFGRFSAPINGKKTRAFALAALIAFLAATLFTAKTALKNGSQAENAWSLERVSQVRKSGKIAYVDFTAAWCLTCLANETAVLNTAKTREFFKANNVELLRADWTDKNPQIAKELEKFGRAGVPLNLVYPANPDRPPIVLPSILTFDAVKNAVKEASQF